MCCDSSKYWSSEHLTCRTACYVYGYWWWLLLLRILCIPFRSLASKRLEEKSLPSSQRKQLTNLISQLDIEISKQGVSDTPQKELSKQRGKEVVTRCFHKMGIVVPYDRNTELGYRPLPLTDSKLTAISNHVYSWKICAWCTFLWLLPCPPNNHAYA